MSFSYNQVDFPQQIPYFTLLYMSELWKAENILEVACGTAKMIPIALRMKKKDSLYTATDISPSMIKLAE